MQYIPRISHNLTWYHESSSNPRHPASAALAPPPGGSISAWGSTLVGCTRIPLILYAIVVLQPRDVPPPVANPWQCRSSSSSGTTSLWGLRKACHAFALSLPLAPHLDPCPFRTTGQALPPTSMPWARVHSCGGRSWGCQATAPLGLSGHHAVGVVESPAQPHCHWLPWVWVRAAEEVHGGSSCCWCFLFCSDQRLDCVALLFITTSSSTLLRMRLSLPLPRLQCWRSWSSHHHWCRAFFRWWRHPCYRSSSQWLDPSLRCCCKLATTAADVAEGRLVMLFSCTVYLHHSWLIVLLNSTARSCWLILCTRTPSLTLQTRALSTALTTSTSTSATSALKGYHMHELLQSKHSHGRSDCGGLSSLFSCLSVRVATAVIAGGC